MAKDPGQLADTTGTPPRLAPGPLQRPSIPWYWIALPAALALLAIWGYWTTIKDVVFAWTANQDYTHGFFVVPISLWLLWIRRGLVPKTLPSPDWRGLLILIVAGLVRVVAARFYLPQLDAWSIPLWIGGVVWLLLGWPIFRWALPSIAFLWFATPLPGTIEILLSTPLQRIAASLSAFVLRVIGQPALAEGTTILLQDQVLDVEKACSGLRMFYGIFALAVACVALARPARWKAVLVLLSAAPVAIIANVARITITGLLLQYASNEAAEKFTHDIAGYFMIPLAVALFMLFLTILGRVVRNMRETGGAVWLIKWSLAILVVVAAFFFWGRYQEARAITTILDTAARYETEKDWPKAIQFLTRYIRTQPDDFDAHSHLAELYRTHASSYSDQLRAIELLKISWKNQPEREDLAISAIELSLRNQNFDEAIQLCDQVLSAPRKPETRESAIRLRAESLYSYLQSDKNRGDYSWDDVKEALEASMKLPKFEITHAVVLADVLRQRITSIDAAEREKQADALIERVITEHADDPMAWLSRFQYQLRYKVRSQEDLPKAEQDLKRAVELAEKQPKNAKAIPVLLTAATRARELNDPKKAEAYSQKAIDADPKDMRAYLLLAEIKRSLNSKESRDEAIKVLRSGIEKIDDDGDIYLTLSLAALLAENQEFDEAEKLIEPIEKIVPYATGIHRGVLKLAVGTIRAQINESKEGVQSALTQLGDLLDNPDVKRTERFSAHALAQAYAFLARLNLALGSSDLALEAYREAARIEPRNSEFQMQAAVLAQQMGDLDAADRDFRKLVQSGGAPPDTRAAIIGLEIQRHLQLNPKDRDWEPVKRMVEAAQQAGGSPIAMRLLAVDILSASGQPEQAEQSLVKLAQEFPKTPAVWRALAMLRLQHNKTDLALEAAGKFSEVTNHDVDAAALRAVILNAAKKNDEALQGLRDYVAKATPERLPRAAMALSQMLEQSGKHDEATSTLEQAHEKAPTNLQVIDMLANTAWLRQEWEKLEKYEKWMEEIEGPRGTLWKSYRSQRLLATAKTIDDKEFKEVVDLANTIVRDRPGWSKSHFLQGEVALRMRQTQAAAEAYERAWKFGGRGVLLGDRLIDLLSRQGRFEDARKYAAQMRDYVGISPVLFDKAMPLAQGNESLDMARQAQQWAKDRPDDPSAHMRLARVLLIMTPTATPEDKKKYIDRANSEIRSALELAPKDARFWAESILLYAALNETRDQAIKLLDEFSKQPDIDELQRNFVLAQLYDSLGASPHAQHYYHLASAQAEANPKAEGASGVLSRTAQFYLSRVPALAEKYARLAVAQNPANGEGKLVLLFLLANRADSASLQEAFKILDDPTTKGGLDPAVETRLRATLLAQGGKPEDVAKGIDLLRRSISPSREDRLLLARLYESGGQIAPAFEILSQIARAPNADAIDMAEYLRFWQLHFLADAAKNPEAEIQFAGQAQTIYQRLGEIRGQLPERIRWQLRELRARDPKGELSTPAAISVVTEALNTPTAKALKPEELKPLVQRIFVVLIQEQCDDTVTQMVAAPPEGILSPEAAVWLCHAYVAAPGPPEVAAKREQIINDLLNKYQDNASLVQSVGDCAFISGKYDTAIKAYELVLKLAPNHPMAQNNLALALAETPERVEEARQVLATAIKADVNNPDLLDTQATLDIIAKQPEKAIPVLQKIIEQNPQGSVPRLHLALAYDEAQDAERAKENLFAAAALGVAQQVLSPRDRQGLADLQQRYLPTATTASGSSQQSETAATASEPKT